MSKSTWVASSTQHDPQQAVIELEQQISGHKLSLLLVFFSVRYDLDQLSTELERAFPETLIVGCSSSGEIGPGGYQNHGLTAHAFAYADFSVSVAEYQHLSQLSIKQWHDETIKLHSEHNCQYKLANDDNSFALLLIDGLSRREEAFTRVVSNAISGIPMIGGSAGDDLCYEATFVLNQGQYHKDSAVLILISSLVPFRVIKTQNIQASEMVMVVTDAIPEQRIITEINGRPAAEEYSHLLGVSNPMELTTWFLAQHPAVVVMGDEQYVRSIQQVNPDGSLTFYCAIDIGIVLRVGNDTDLVASLSNAINAIQSQIGSINSIVAFDCILRRLQLIEQSRLYDIEQLLQPYNCVGFSTYGEQFNGLHVNQTCTAIAFGDSRNG